MEDQHLAVAIGAGADADGGRRNFFGDHGGDFARDAFQHDRENAGLIESDGVAHELFDGRSVLP